jgi:hypothetical protein
MGSVIGNLQKSKARLYCRLDRAQRTKPRHTGDGDDVPLSAEMNIGIVRLDGDDLALTALDVDMHSRRPERDRCGGRKRHSISHDTIGRETFAPKERATCLLFRSQLEAAQRRLVR